jgi:arylsulfatase K
VAGPGIAPGGRVDSLVSLVDVYPTLMDLAGLPHPEGLMGHSLLPEIGGGVHPERPGEVFSEYHSNFQNTSSFMLRRGEYKYIAYAGYEPQLFHLSEDPEEMHNLVAERPAVAAEMAAGLRAIVDYDAVARDVLAYNREAFRAWRDGQDPAAYQEAMARFYKGWGPAEERIVEEWLAQG